MIKIIKNIQNIDIYDSLFLLERREDYDDEEAGCIENSEDEKEKIILSKINFYESLKNQIEFDKK